MNNWKFSSCLLLDIAALPNDALSPVDIGVLWRKAYKPTAKWDQVFRPPADDLLLYNDPCVTGYTTEYLETNGAEFDAASVQAVLDKLAADIVVVYNWEYVHQVLTANGLTLPTTCVGVIDLLPWMYFYLAAPEPGRLQLESHADLVDVSCATRSMRHVHIIHRLLARYFHSFPSDLDALLSRQEDYRMAFLKLLDTMRQRDKTKGEP